MSNVSQAASFAASLYSQRAGTAYRGYVRRDPMALLHLRPGRVNPYAIYDVLRDRGPVSRTLRGNWVSPSHRVCSAVLRDRRFGVVPAGLPPGQPPADGDMSFLSMNPPDHTRLRRLALPSFSPRAVGTYHDRIERTVATLLDRLGAAESFDLVSEFAAPLPIAVITDLLGVPDADSTEFARYGVVIGSALDGIKSLRHARELQANDIRLRALFESLFELRRREPSDDVVSRLVAAEGDAVAPAEMLPMCVLLLVAGFETTVNLIGNGVLALLSNPDQWRALCADPAGLAGKAVEETLRFDPPVQRTERVALEPVEVEGVPIGKDEWIATLIGAANRDPDAFERPAEFDIHRERAADHLAFSSGIHYCLGQPLARLEATIAFRMLAERMPGLTLAGPVRRRSTTIIRGPIRLPLTPGTARAPRVPAPAGG